MLTIDIFKQENLPDILSNADFAKYYHLMKSGDQNARDIIISHNLRLVIYCVSDYFSLYGFQKEDLVSVGCIGLINAVDTYDITKNYAFSTYAFNLIRHSIFIYLRNESVRIRRNISLYEPLYDEDFKPQTILDRIANDDMPLSDLVEDNALKEEVNSFINLIKEPNQEIIKLYFGYYDNVTYNQKEIGDMLGMSRANVSRIIIQELTKLQKEFTKRGYIENNKVKAKLRHVLYNTKNTKGEK